LSLRPIELTKLRDIEKKQKRQNKTKKKKREVERKKKKGDLKHPRTWTFFR